ncbi:proteoglycan 4-like isoform X2 [Dermacentor albipictus]|uniref:proteoglycan 4-like isoform X2 n=1 Tax=Dermacentor albipictus TaxID=60249 RepID=UPI0031FC833B
MSKKASSENRRNSDATVAAASTAAATLPPEAPVPGATHRSRSSRGHQAAPEWGAIPRRRSVPVVVPTDATAPRRGRRGSCTMISSSATGQVNLVATEQQQEEVTTTTDTEASSPLFSQSKSSRGWQGRKRSSGPKKAKSAEAQGSALVAANFVAPAQEAIVAKPSKHHSSTAKPSSVPDPSPVQPPPPSAPPPESKVVTSDRSSVVKRHQHVPSAPVQSPETGGDGCLLRSTTPAVVAAEQPSTTPNKKVSNHIAAESTEAPPSEAKGAASDRPKSTKSHRHLPAAPAQSPETPDLATGNPPSDAVPSQGPPTSPKMPEQPAPAASERVPETQPQHSAPNPINVPASEPAQLFTSTTPFAATDASTDHWLVPFAGSLPAIGESSNCASGPGSANAPLEAASGGLHSMEAATRCSSWRLLLGGIRHDSMLSAKSGVGSSTMEATGFRRGLIIGIIIGCLILLLLFVLPLGPSRPKISSTAPVGPPSSSPLP